MRAHAHDLRAEVDPASSPELADALVDGIARDWRTANLSAPDRALAAFAAYLTSSPADLRREHVDALRAVGFDDIAIHDATQIVGYFNYINRVAEALGVDLEPKAFVRAWGS